MRHFSTLSKRVEFSSRGEPGKFRWSRIAGGRGKERVIASSLALLSRLFFIAMVSRVSL